MGGQNYYLISALPALGEPGSAPPLSLGQVLEHVSGAATQPPSPKSGPRELLEALLLGDDLLQREAFLAGEIEEPAPTVLTAGQARDEEPLPEYLTGGPETTGPRIPGDALWRAYYHHAAEVARRGRSSFLAAWVRHEVGLRNALAEARAKALDLDPSDYLVATELGDEEGDFSGIISDWAAASDPLAGMHILDGARWHWLGRHDAWFTFGDDELAAYAARLMLLHRWHRLTAASSGGPRPGDAGRSGGDST